MIFCFSSSGTHFFDPALDQVLVFNKNLADNRIIEDFSAVELGQEKPYKKQHAHPVPVRDEVKDEADESLRHI